MNMANNELIRRVRIYLNERDMVEGQPLYLATLEQLRRAGATGATALRGIAGFGAGSRLRTAGPADFTSAPIVIEWVDRAERVARVLPALDALLPTALITIEDLQVHRALLRAGGPFGERTVGDVMLHEIATAELAMPLRAAAELMLERDQLLLPALDERRGLAGVLTAGDLARRAGLALPLPLLGALTADEQRVILDQLPERTVGDVLTTDPRTVYVEAPIALALSPMVEWGIANLPVLDRAGQLAGLFGVEQALRAALRDRTEDDGPVRDAEPPTTVALVMQRAVPTIAATVELSDVLVQLLAAPDHFLVVMDAGLPVGTLTDLQLAKTLGEPLRSTWLAALRSPVVPLPQALEGAAGQTAGSLADRALPSIGTQATQEQAIQLMLANGYARLVVLDEQGRLAGLLGRGGLLRALAQASAS
jgi:PII-like signaling protein/predicted transcriptional regulator